MKFLEILVNFIITWVVFAIIAVVVFFAWKGILIGLKVGFGVDPFFSFLIIGFSLLYIPGPIPILFAVLGLTVTQGYLGWPIWQSLLVYFPTMMVSLILLVSSFILSVSITFVEMYKCLFRK